MVGKITSGKFAAGIFEYLAKEKSEIISKNMGGETKEELTKEFLMCTKLNTRVQKPVKHHVISFAPQDRSKLTPEVLQSIVKDYLYQSGFTNNQYAAYIHFDTNIEHLHLVINKISFDGINTHPKFEKRSARKILMDLEQKYNLTRTPEKSLDKSKNYDRGVVEMEQRFAATDGKRETEKDQIKRVIKAALERNPTSKEQFIKLSKSAGVEVLPNKAGNGYKFRYKETEYKASTIDRKLSFANIEEQIQQNQKAEELKQQQKERERQEQERIRQEREENDKIIRRMQRRM